ncbi:Lsr2 dimerization domain-containing protein [Kocuria oceani]|uniref:Lsr2 dimerization domain-containing protein n=1 Tax=Kocuria oceani TaxID=988827 RepID=A0ABV9TK90_9MICC|nr:hypothetical protein [Kocuria oceani]
MVQKVKVHLEDDLDCGRAKDTIQSSLDGKDYERPFHRQRREFA